MESRVSYISWVFNFTQRQQMCFFCHLRECHLSFWFSSKRLQGTGLFLFVAPPGHAYGLSTSRTTPAGFPTHSSPVDQGGGGKDNALKATGVALMGFGSKEGWEAGEGQMLGRSHSHSYILRFSPQMGHWLSRGAHTLQTEHLGSQRAQRWARFGAESHKLCLESDLVHLRFRLMAEPPSL